MKLIVVSIILIALLFIPIIPHEREVNKGAIVIEHQPIIRYIIQNYIEGK